MKRQLITERDVIDAANHGTKILMIQSNSIITSAARDEAQKRSVQFSVQPQHAMVAPASNLIPVSETSSQPFQRNSMTIALGSDHGGFRMKEALHTYLAEQGNRIIDVGTDSELPCDYPDFAYAVASLVSSRTVERGIIIDSVGVASAIVANKVPGVRAVPCYDEFVARSSREHNDANVLSLGARFLSIEEAKSAVKLWLQTTFSGDKRHIRRLEEIDKLEESLYKNP